VTMATKAAWGAATVVVRPSPLDHACNDLDEAVQALPDMSSDNCMQSGSGGAALARGRCERH